jgi:hypothetical protein
VDILAAIDESRLTLKLVYECTVVISSIVRTFSPCTRHATDVQVALRCVELIRSEIALEQCQTIRILRRKYIDRWYKHRHDQEILLSTPLRYGSLGLDSKYLSHNPVGQSLGRRLLFGTRVGVQSFEEV